MHRENARKRRESKELENLLEKIRTENFPNLVMEIDIHIQEAQKVPNKMNLKRPIKRHIIIKMPKVKDKERILKAARQKQLVPDKTVSSFFNRNFAGQKGLARNIQSDGKQGPLLSKAII